MRITTSLLLLAVLGQPALACRQLVVFPEHLPAASTTQLRYYLVEIEAEYPALASQAPDSEAEYDLVAENGLVIRVVPPQGLDNLYRGTLLAGSHRDIDKGMEVFIKMDSQLDAHAVCAFKPKVGETYLLRAISAGPNAGQQAVLLISPYDGFNLPSTHHKFDSYVRDIERMAAATAPTPGDMAAAPFLIDLPDNASFTLPSVLPPR